MEGMILERTKIDGTIDGRTFFESMIAGNTEMDFFYSWKNRDGRYDFRKSRG